MNLCLLEILKIWRCDWNLFFPPPFKVFIFPMLQINYSHAYAFFIYKN